VTLPEAAMTRRVDIVRNPREREPQDRGAAGPRTFTDAELVAEIVAGNPAVADTFCMRVLPTVDRTIRRLLGRDDWEHEDLTQIAVIELVRAVVGYRGESSLDTWVAAVTARVVYKHIRRRPIERHVAFDLVGEAMLPRSRANGENALAAREILARILRHLNSIGEKLASSFVLHDVLGHPLCDIARITHTSEAAAQSRLVRGRRRLHKRLAEDPELTDLFIDLEHIQGR
jgi:RNA polymerase sigma factor (sigma-70 family)